MAPIVALWLPILLSAVIVFIVSSLMHVVLTYHNSDFKPIAEEEKVSASIRAAAVAPGYYMFPYCNHKQIKSPEMQEKFRQGPVGMLIVRPNGMPHMGKHLAMWFSYCLLISIFVAYLAGNTLVQGAPYLAVFRVAATAAFLAYGIGPLSNSIWKGHPIALTLKEVFDGLIYALVTASTFSSLWPR